MRRRIVITTGAVVVVLATALAGAASGLADEPPAVDLEIGYPPPCGDEDATTLSAVDCAGVEPVERHRAYRPRDRGRSRRHRTGRHGPRRPRAAPTRS